MRTELLTTTLAIACALPLAAQGARSRVPVVPDRLLALARQNLSFRTVLPGIPSSVRPREIDRAALFEIQGPTGGAVRLEFLLPDALRSDNLSARLPIAFGAADGFASREEHTTVGTTFNPNLPLITTLGDGGRLFVRLGGTVRPGIPQAGGAYSGEIMLLVYSLGS